MSYSEEEYYDPYEEEWQDQSLDYDERYQLAVANGIDLAEFHRYHGEMPQNNTNSNQADSATKKEGPGKNRPDNHKKEQEHKTTPVAAKTTGETINGSLSNAFEGLGVKEGEEHENPNPTRQFKWPPGTKVKRFCYELNAWISYTVGDETERDIIEATEHGNVEEENRETIIMKIFKRQLHQRENDDGYVFGDSVLVRSGLFKGKVLTVVGTNRKSVLVLYYNEKNQPGYERKNNSTVSKW